MGRFSPVAAGAVLALASTAFADVPGTESYSGSVSFTSDLEPALTITLPGFDTSHPNPNFFRQLQQVTVTISHSGGAEPAADNDDPFQGATVRARVIRQWSAEVPGEGTIFGSEVETSMFVDLGPDDGDGPTFDPSAPDGFAFGVLGYTDIIEAVRTPALDQYEDVEFVDFDVAAVLMTNDLQFQGEAPDAWTLEVENPFLDVTVTVTYDYKLIPAPSAMALLGLGGLVAVRRRR